MLSNEERKTVKNIVNELFDPATKYFEQSSYTMKHVIEQRVTGLYIHNDEMKSIMSELGYIPDSKTALNTRYKIRYKQQ